MNRRPHIFGHSTPRILVWSDWIASRPVWCQRLAWIGASNANHRSGGYGLHRLSIACFTWVGRASQAATMALSRASVQATVQSFSWRPDTLFFWSIATRPTPAAWRSQEMFPQVIPAGAMERTRQTRSIRQTVRKTVRRTDRLSA